MDGKEEAVVEDTLSVSDSASNGSESGSDTEDTEEATLPGSSVSVATSSGTKAPVKRLSWLDKKKKGLASRAAGSSLGNSLFEKYVDKDTQMLIDSICVIISKENGAKAAKKTKQEILKVAVKILMLYHSKKVTEDSFTSLSFSLRRIFSAVRNAYHAKTLNEATANRIHGVALSFYENLQASLAELVSDNTMQRISKLIETVLSPGILVAATKYDKEFQQIAMVLATYLEVSS